MVRDLLKTHNHLVLEVCCGGKPKTPAYPFYGQPLLEVRGGPYGVRVMVNAQYGIVLVGTDSRTENLGVLVVPHSRRTCHAESSHKQSYITGKHKPTGGYKFAGNALGVTGDDAYTDGSDRRYQKRKRQTPMTLTSGSPWVIWGVLRWEGSVMPSRLQRCSTDVR